MTIDPETKAYIDKMHVEMSIKLSALISSVCSELERKKVFDRQAFMNIMQESQNITQQAAAIGFDNFAKLAINANDLKKAIDELAKKQSQKRDWSDLK